MIFVHVPAHVSLFHGNVRLLGDEAIESFGRLSWQGTQ